MIAVFRSIQRAGGSALSRLDALFNRIYTWRYNPLYHSGALVVGCFVVLCVTGLYLLLFYRIGGPYASIERLVDQPWGGRWIRTLHRYISDLAIVAAVIHAFRMGVQDRAWGPRALAWLSGIALLLTFFVCGWTGYVMVWDTQAQLLAMEGARLLDVLPIFSEPIARTFVGESPMPQAFFFLNLFAHIAIPVGIVFVLWLHVSRLARTYLMPPRPLFWGMVGVFTVASIAFPAALGPEADLLSVPSGVVLDVFYSFWIPLSSALPAGAAWLVMLAGLTAVSSVPLLTKPRGSAVPAPSYVNPRFCTGCEQCYHDCPYEAISMERRTDGREGIVGFVDPAKCVSCGICSGSCAPMGVGPAGRTGRDQLTEVEEFIERVDASRQSVVVIACSRTAAGWGRSEIAESPILPVSCAGSLHTSVVEYLIRAGAGGVVIAACPPRDCWNREGVAWLEERLYNEREAELKDRVDRRRLRVVYAAEHERTALEAQIHEFRRQAGALDRALTEKVIKIDTRCDPPVVSVVAADEP